MLIAYVGESTLKHVLRQHEQNSARRLVGNVSAMLARTAMKLKVASEAEYLPWQKKQRQPLRLCAPGHIAAPRSRKSSC
jgi:hypothetical protein